MGRRRIARSFRVAVLAGGLALAGCEGGLGGGQDDGGEEDTGPEPQEPEDVIDQAKEELPTYLDLHTNVIARTCSPDEGVCHHAKEYPDLTSPQAMLGGIGMDCNVAVDDPLSMFNGCEQEGDELRFPEYGPNKDWKTEIAWSETVKTSIPDQSGSDVILHLRDPIPNPMNAPSELESMFIWRNYPDESVEMAAYYGVASYEAGETALTVHLIEDLGDNQIIALGGGLHMGDPNRDGVFGADETTYKLIEPGDPQTSYLLGRLLGQVPGTPMPLANQPLSSAEVLALTCWIEGLAGEEPDVYGAIDYDGCQAAADFGKGDPESGHSFSNDVQPILDRCTAGGCHSDSSPAAGLNLTAGAAHDSLMRASSQDPETLLVTPGNPTNSYLMMKLWGTQVSGLQMPREAGGPGEPLPDEDLRVIERWIIAGAPND